MENVLGYLYPALDTSVLAPLMGGADEQNTSSELHSNGVHRFGESAKSQKNNDCDRVETYWILSYVPGKIDQNCRRPSGPLEFCRLVEKKSLKLYLQAVNLVSWKICFMKMHKSIGKILSINYSVNRFFIKHFRYFLRLDQALEANIVIVNKIS